MNATEPCFKRAAVENMCNNRASCDVIEFGLGGVSEHSRSVESTSKCKLVRALLRKLLILFKAFQQKDGRWLLCRPEKVCQLQNHIFSMTCKGPTFSVVCNFHPLFSTQ